MPRGGKRPGAGAPKGTLNAFKHGRNSRQYLRLLELASQDPETRRLLAKVARGNRRQHKRNVADARRIFDGIIRVLNERHTGAERRLADINRTTPGHPGTAPNISE